MLMSAVPARYLANLTDRMRHYLLIEQSIAKRLLLVFVAR